LKNDDHDPHEKNGLSASRRDIVAQIRRKIEAWHPIAEK
jgi:hypothetical protein